MLQDTYGFMWFGTYDGLNLYNGKDVLTFRFEYDNPNSLSGNTIHNITQADKDHLWISTHLGLNKFSLKRQKVVESYIEYKKIVLLSADLEGNAYIIIKDDFISYYNAKQKRFKEIPIPNNKIADVKAQFVNSDNVLCLVMKGGVIKYVQFDVNAKNQITTREISFHSKKIEQVFYEDDQIYFIDEDQNLFVYDYIKQQKILIRNIGSIINKYGIISSLTLFHNEIYIAFMHSGLVRLSASNHEEPQTVDVTIGIFCLLKDRFQEAMWVGTDGQGVDLYYNEKDVFGNILLDQFQFTAKKPVRALYTDDEASLWIGTKGDGIMRVTNYDKATNSSLKIENVQHFITDGNLFENPVYKFYRSQYNEDDLWIGTHGNISYYSYKENKIYPLEEIEETNRKLTNVHTLCEVSDSVLWVSSQGLYRVVIDKNKKPYKIKSKKYYPFYKNGVDINEEFYSMIFDGDSTIFLGSKRGYGVIKFNIYTQEYNFMSLSTAQNKALGDVLCLHMNKDSVLYIGASSGLTIIKMYKFKENDVKQFNRRDGIINDMIHGILEDNQGIIWLSTNKGLVKYNPKNDSFFNVKSSQIGVTEFSDGAYLKCPITNRLFFGGVNGLTWIEPTINNTINSYEPELLFSEINLYGNSHTLLEYNGDSTKQITLKANQNHFQISFTVNDYINGENYDYFYQLENFNPTWISIQKENTINFTNLPSGNYILKVRFKNDVIETEARVFSLPIRILPPWYRTPVAIVIYFIIFILIIFLAYYNTRLKFQKKQHLAALRIKKEQEKQLYESKLKFFTNITHELYTPLTLINGALEQINKEEMSAPIKKYSNILQNNVSSLNELIQEILEYRKVEESEGNQSTFQNTNISTMLKALLTSFKEIAKQNKIDLVSFIPNNLLWNTDEGSFKKIASNLISNAFKYTPAEGTVKVDIFVENEMLILIVFNTGKGIAQDKIDSIFNRYYILEDTEVNANNQMTARHGLGLSICHSMVKLLNGKIKVESEVNKYTQFKVMLPNLMPTEHQRNNIEILEPSKQERVNSNILVPEKIKGNVHKENNHPNILIVDDNEEIVELVGDILSPNYNVQKAYNAQDALQILKEQSPSLIITDIMMPEIDGLTLIQMIKEDKFNMHLPIVALSAKIDIKDQAKGFDAGADAYITKPFSSNLLTSVVSRLLSSKQDLKDYYDSAESSFEYTYGKLVHQKDSEFIDSILVILNKNLADPDLGPEFVSSQLKMSSRNLNRELKRILSITPSDFIKDYKLSYAAKLLLTTNLFVKEIINQVGITNKSFFYNEFAKKYNCSPKQYRTANQEKAKNTDENNS